MRRRVAGANKAPSNWAHFLHDSENKDELDSFLAEGIAAHSYSSEKQVLVTHHEHVLTNASALSNINDCSHEEPDTQMMVHLDHALANGAQSVAIDSGDTDVLVILLGCYHQLKAKYSFKDVIIDFPGNRRFSIDILSQVLGQTKC